MLDYAPVRWYMMLAQDQKRRLGPREGIGAEMVRHWLLLLLLAAISVTPPGAQSQDFVQLDIPSERLRALPSQCPIRVELPLKKLFQAKEPIYRTGKAAVVNCEGAYISVIKVANYPQVRGLKPRIHAQVTVFLPAGHDKLVEVKYGLIQGKEILATGAEEIKADEGKSNWEDGADLWYPKDAVAESLSLRIEAVFTDR
jgi:hypothetical protein